MPSDTVVGSSNEGSKQVERELKHPYHKQKRQLPVETVLVMQGGGSLGAYECGVYKSLAKHNIKFDIVSGTSIGAINAAIIAAHRNNNDNNSLSSYGAACDAAKALEDFWLELAENILPLPDNISDFYFTDEMRANIAAIHSALYGNPKAFYPRWVLSDPISSLLSISSFKPLPYPMFDITPLKKTLDRYVDLKLLIRSNDIATTNVDSKNDKNDGSKNKSNNNNNRPRLIVTSTDVKTSKPVVFDSKQTTIGVDDITASACFPFYGISWIKKGERYLWDGALLSNTPLREVIDASPIADKIVYLVNIFPQNQDELPQDMFEVWHRARDIIYTDKTDSSIRMSKVISRYLSLLDDMHDLLMITANKNLNQKRRLGHEDGEEENDQDRIIRDRFMKMEQEYNKLAIQRGAIIRKIVRIERPEKIHFLFEDADFSIATIKDLIKRGENDAERALQSEEKQENQSNIHKR
jgi:NTE family protein